MTTAETIMGAIMFVATLVFLAFLFWLSRSK